MGGGPVASGYRRRRYRSQHRVVGQFEPVQLVSALDYAIWSSDVRDGQLIHHSDMGCQYTSVRFTQRLVDAGIAPWTGGVGDSFDNALAENLWSTLKIELIYWPATTFATRAEARAALFRYIDGWYNPRRIQAGLDGLSPGECEAAWQARQSQPRSATLQPEGAETR